VLLGVTACIRNGFPTLFCRRCMRNTSGCCESSCDSRCRAVCIPLS
jgi:hypothetical protein